MSNKKNNVIFEDEEEKAREKPSIRIIVVKNHHLQRPKNCHQSHRTHIQTEEFQGKKRASLLSQSQFFGQSLI